jgi:hypothetical protein
MKTMDKFSDGKAIFVEPQNVVWSKIDNPNKWEVQEPYGYFQYSIELNAWVQNKENTRGVAFYTAPPQREWVGLTDDEIGLEWHYLHDDEGNSPDEWVFARAIEAKLKEKNS